MKKHTAVLLTAYLVGGGLGAVAAPSVIDIIDAMKPKPVLIVESYKLEKAKEDNYSIKAGNTYCMLNLKARDVNVRVKGLPTPADTCNLLKVGYGITVKDNNALHKILGPVT